MNQLEKKLTELSEALTTTLVKLKFPEKEIHFEYPKEESHGDYATNIAFQLSKELGSSPLEIAEKIVKIFPKIPGIEYIQVAAPGFINFSLSEEYITDALKNFNAQKKIDSGKEIKICIDSSHPNIAKPLHFGHLRSTILGESLARIFRYTGGEVLQDNFLGDWGTQFGKLVVAIHKWGDRESIDKNPIKELTKLYQKFHKEVEDDPELEKQGAEEFRKMEIDRDEENLTLWKWIVDESMKEVQVFYDLMDAHFDCIRGESFWEPRQAETLKLMQEKKVSTEGEGGALVVHFPEKTKLPTMIYRRSDGATLYQTRDLTRILYYDKEGYTVLSHIVANDQFMHFKRVFETAKMLGVTAKCEHIDFGLVRLPEGKLSTRKGVTINLMEIFDEAKKRVRTSLDERGTDFSEEEKNELVKMIAIGAIKFNDLSQNRTTDITFDWERMLSFEGFSAPFLQYAYARARSILRKKEAQEQSSQNFKITHPAERRLAKTILDFHQNVLLAAEKRMPHFIAEYVYELASTFNNFYGECPILQAGEDERNSRLFLTTQMCETLQQGLFLLGIGVPEKM